MGNSAHQSHHIIVILLPKQNDAEQKYQLEYFSISINKVKVRFIEIKSCSK